LQDRRLPPSGPDSPAILTLLKAPDEALSAWRGALAGVFDVGAPACGDASFDGAFVAHATGRFILSQARTPPMRLARSAETIAGGDADGFAVRVQISGGVAGRTGDRPVECAAGDILFIDLLQTLDLRVTAGEGPASDVTLWMPRAKMLAALADDNALHGFVLAGASPTAAMIGGSLRLLAQHVGEMTTIEIDAFADGLVESIAKSITPMLEKLGDPNGARSLMSFVTLRRYIDNNLRSPSLNTNNIARTFGLSRASLCRLFKPVGGVATYIRKARLNRVYQDIAASELSNRRIGPIAYRMGFKNLSAFNRLFKETYGVSPSEAREQAMHGLASIPPKVNPGEAPSLGFWLARLGAVASMGERIS
jgi:AraC-like DNA-binding protein